MASPEKIAGISSEASSDNPPRHKRGLGLDLSAPKANLGAPPLEEMGGNPKFIWDWVKSQRQTFVCD